MIRSILETIRKPSAKWALGTLVGAGLVVGVVSVPTFDYVMAETSSNEFCASCHDIAPAIAEFEGSVHDVNKTGVSVTCADCHIPHEFVPKMMRKVRALNEIYHSILGTIDTPEKFEEHRLRMATFTWNAMNENDSALCRHCHDTEKWDLAMQSEKARKYHAPALSNDKTCIDCHKGLAHALPEGIGEDTLIEGIDY